MIIDSIRRHPSAVAAIGAVVAIGAVLATLVAGSPASVRSGTPVLRLVHRFPLTIRGYGFRPGRRVTVTLSAMPSTTRHRVVGRDGGFTVMFGTVPDRCASWAVTASQRHHPPVVLHGALPECAPASAP